MPGFALTALSFGLVTLVLALALLAAGLALLAGFLAPAGFWLAAGAAGVFSAGPMIGLSGITDATPGLAEMVSSAVAGTLAEIASASW